MTQDFKIKLACSAGVLLVRANVKSSQSFIRPAMFDLELEWTRWGWGPGKSEKTPAQRGKQNTPWSPWLLAHHGTEFCKMTMTSGRRNLHFPIPTSLLFFDRRPSSWYRFPSLPSLPLPLKWKMAAIIFVKKVLSTRSPKLRLTCRRKLSKKCTFIMYFSNYLGWRCRVFINSDLRLCTWLWMRFFCHTQWLQNNKGLIRSLTKPNHWGTDEATGSDTSLLIWIKPMTVL